MRQQNKVMSLVAISKQIINHMLQNTVGLPRKLLAHATEHNGLPH